MRTSSGAKPSRWVYEGGELESNSKSPISYYSMFYDCCETL
jgi:hypothetical protein